MVRWRIATVSVDFDVHDTSVAARLADVIFDDLDVLTVRVGDRGRRSVYRVDIQDEGESARGRALDPARRAASSVGVDMATTRVTISDDGLGDPDDPGSRPGRRLPWLVSNET